MNTYISKYINVVFSKPFKWALLISLVFIALILTAYNKFYYYNIWSSFPVNEGIENYFCEHIHQAALIKQPVNALSNVAFLFLGCCLFLHYKNYNENYNTKWFGITTGIVLIYTAFGSTFYHASLTEFSHFFDISACYFLATLPLLYFSFYLLSKYFRNSTRHSYLLRNVMLIYLVANVLFSFSKWYISYYKVFSVFSIAGLLVIIALDGFWFMYKNKLLAFTMLLNIIAVAFYFIDYAKIFHWPDSYIQFHAGWHILSAITFFLYFVSSQYISYED